MSQLLGPTGRPISSAMFHKKDKAPHLGPAFGDWAGRDIAWNQMPGGAVLQFDVSTLTLADFRAMRSHPQINASLSLLSFILHQIDWSIECEDKKIATAVEENMREVWSRLIRGLSQSFWAGYSPCIFEYENNPHDGLDIKITKVKDLYPEDCSVHWKEVEGALPPGSPTGSIPPKLKIYDGMKQFGAARPIPPEFTLWYPLLMSNGNYYGTKLLSACFTPWYFSTLIHLFANRYYERFGEPTPVGRAPFDEEIIGPDGTAMNGKLVMETILMNLRNRGTVTLPSDRNPVTNDYDYTLDYMESQMRGADFERYLSRLDEEISLGLFTPLLMLKTGDVGSNNLGVQHTQTWLWMLNALAADLAEYITRYMTERLKGINFGPNKPICRWVPRPLGKENTETLRAIVTELIRKDKVKPDVTEMGEALGMTFTEIKQVTQPDPALTLPGQQQQDGNVVRLDDRQRTERDRSRGGQPRGVGEARATGRQINNRLRPQIERAFRDGTFGPEWRPDFGYRRRFQAGLESDGYSESDAARITGEVYEDLDRWIGHATKVPADEFGTANDFSEIFSRRFDEVLDVRLAS